MFKQDLKKKKTIILSGAGGILCSNLVVALAKQRHNIAVLDLRKVAVDGVATEINFKSE